MGEKMKKWRQVSEQRATWHVPSQDMCVRGNFTALGTFNEVRKYLLIAGTEVFFVALSI